MFLLPATAQSPTAAPNGQPGGILSLSASGTNAATGILWASHQLVGDANQSVQPGILRAYNAENVSIELWNSQQNSSRDAVGSFAKFVPPTVANGKVYLATFSNRLDVYGLLPQPSLSVAFSANTDLRISWSVSSGVGFTPQTSTNLASGAWLNLTNAITQSNGNYQVEIQAGAPAAFYRLQR